MINIATAKKNRYFILTLLLFLLPLLYAWHYFPWIHFLRNTLSIYATLGAYIPYSDAAGYYGGAQHFLHHGQLTAFTARRPLNALFLATRFFWLGTAIKPALLFQALLCGTATFLASCAVKNRMGARLATLFLLANFSYIAFYLPTLLNTPLGFILGSFSFVLLLESIHYKSVLNFSLGLFVLTLALFARAGAFFVLPLLILWAGYYFKHHQRLRWSAILLSTLACLAAYALNKFLVMQFSAPHAGLMSNFSWTLYGLVTGKGWLFAAKTLPQTGHSASAYNHLVFQQSLQFFLKQPRILFQTLWNNILHFQIYSPYSLAYLVLIGASLLMKVGSAPPQRKSAISLLCCLCMAGLLLTLGIITVRQTGPLLGACISLHCLAYLYYLSKKSQPTAQFYLFALIGIIASAAILWDDGRARVFAATMPLYIGAYLYALYYFFYPDGSPVNTSDHHSAPNRTLSRISFGMTLCILLITIGTALFIQSNTKSKQPHLKRIKHSGPVWIKTTWNDPRMIISPQDNATHNTVNALHYLAILKHSGIEEPMLTDLQHLTRYAIKMKQPIALRLTYANDRLYYLAGNPSALNQPRMIVSPTHPGKILTKNSTITWISPNSPKALEPSYADRRYPIK